MKNILKIEDFKILERNRLINIFYIYKILRHFKYEIFITVV